MKVLITGASEGIGRSFALELSRRGYLVTAVARNEERLKDLMRDLMLDVGTEHSYVPADLTSEVGVAKISQVLKAEKFDLLINNAGLATYATFREMKADDIDKTMGLNCMALVELSRVFLAGAKSGDALINVSSTASFLPMPISSVYAGSKSFVTGFTESLWFEERKRGVYVMALCPGVTATKFHTRAGGNNEQIPPWFSQTPEQVVHLALKKLKHRGSPIVISGPQKHLIFFAKFFPRRWVILLSGYALDWGLRAKKSL